MSKYANVSVEAKPLPYNASFDERERNFRNLMSAFRKAVNMAGIMKEIKKNEYYETPSQKRRREARERESNLLKTKMKESFLEGGNVYKSKNKNRNEKGPKKF